jgi:hypothetical protein
MANCSYSLSGQIPRDAQYISAVRSKRFIGCVGKLNELEVREIRVEDIIDQYNVKYYGAVGDGLTDDTAAFQAALATGFKQITVPTGEYLLSDSLTLSTNQQLIGESDRSSVLSFSNSDVNFTALTAPTGSSLKDMHLQYTGSNSTTSTMVSVTGSNVDISGVLIDGGAAYGISFDALESDTLLFNNQIEATLSGVRFTAAYSLVNILANHLIVGLGGTVIDTTNGGSLFRIMDNKLEALGGVSTGISASVSLTAIGNDYNVTTPITGAGLATSTVHEPLNTGYSVNTPGRVAIDGVPVLNNQQTAIADAAARGVAYVQAEAQDTTDQLNLVIAALRAHGLIAT